MSTGFRLVLLTLLAFAVLWMSRWRARDLDFWLGAPDSVRRTLETAESEGSPVDGVPPGLVRIEIRSPDLRPEPAPPEPEAASRGRAASGWGALYGEEPSTWSDPPPPEGDVERGSDSGGAVVDGPVPERLPPAVEPGGAPRPLPSERDRPRVGREEPDGSALDEPRIYTVRSGDNLSKISRKLLGKEQRYREIIALNRDVLGGSTLIFPGTKLRIPPR